MRPHAPRTVPSRNPHRAHRRLLAPSHHTPRHELASRHKRSGICCCDPVCTKGGGTRDSPFPSCTWCGLLLGLTIPGLGLVCCLRCKPHRLHTLRHPITPLSLPITQHFRTRSRPHPSRLGRPDCEMFGCTCNRVVHPMPSKPKRGRGGFFESLMQVELV